MWHCHRGRLTLLQLKVHNSGSHGMQSPWEPQEPMYRKCSLNTASTHGECAASTAIPGVVNSWSLFDWQEFIRDQVSKQHRSGQWGSAASSLSPSTYPSLSPCPLGFELRILHLLGRCSAD
jgi:hypothetical protein